MQLRLNTVCGSLLHSGLSITQTPETPVTLDLITVLLIWQIVCPNITSHNRVTLPGGR